MKIKKINLEATAQVGANMVYGYNGSDPKKPPYNKLGLKAAVMMLQELLDVHESDLKDRIIREIKKLRKRTKRYPLVYPTDENVNAAYDMAIDGVIKLIREL